MQVFLPNFNLEWHIEVPDAQLAEKIVFFKLKDYRTRPNREFFNIEISHAISIIKRTLCAFFEIESPVIFSNGHSEIFSKLESCLFNTWFYCGKSRLERPYHQYYNADVYRIRNFIFPEELTNISRWIDFKEDGTYTKHKVDSFPQKGIWKRIENSIFLTYRGKKTELNYENGQLYIIPAENNSRKVLFLQSQTLSNIK